MTIFKNNKKKKTYSYNTSEETKEEDSYGSY
jgi:hypothetical protein